METSVLVDTFDSTLQGTNISLWLAGISAEAAETVSSLDDGDRDNLMYNTEFVTYFMDLCRLFPLWSGICCQFFPRSRPTASTGNVESHIKVLKQSMEDIIPCSVDRFVQENMDMVEGMIIEASQNYIKFITDTGEMEFDLIIEEASQTEFIQEAEQDEFPNNGDAAKDSFTEETIFTTKAYSNKDRDKIVETDENNSIGDNSDVDIEVVSDVNIVSCLACKDKNWPSGAHKCIICGKNVHIFPGCSLSIGGSEGYGERRICVSCDIKREKQKTNKISEMGLTEDWCRTSKRELKKSKYLMPVPNWNLNHHFNKTAKIGFLTNGNFSLRVFGTKNELIGLKNTCSFDALAQVR